mgnify:CR=1 FL=1
MKVFYQLIIFPITTVSPEEVVKSSITVPEKGSSLNFLNQSNLFSIDDMCNLFSCFRKQKFLFLFLLFNSFHKVISLEKYFLLKLQSKLICNLFILALDQKIWFL